MRRVLGLVALLSALILTLAGCGATVTHSRVVGPGPAPVVGPSGPAGPVGACTPADYSMQCGLQGQPTLLQFQLHPHAAVLAYGIDFGWGGPSVRWLQSAHVRFAASYYSYDSSKNWGAGQVASYHAGHIYTVGVWESTAARALDGFAAGASDARQARAEARAVGEPASRPIYFAVDFDSTRYGCAICGYFRGADAVLGVSHTGAYGGLVTIQTLFGQHLIRYGWQTYAWSRGIWDGRAQLQQYLNGSTLDWDRALARDYGQWPYAAPVLYPVCYHHRLPKAQCRATRAHVASWTRAVHATGNALEGAQRVLAADHCRKRYRRPVCVGYGQLDSVLAQRARWFSARIHTTIAKS